MELESLYCKDGDSPFSFSKDYAVVSLVQKGIHGLLYVEMVREDVNGLHRVLHVLEFSPKKGGKGIPKTFQTGNVKMKEIDIDDDETLRNKYAGMNIIVLDCWKIPRRSTENNQNAVDNSADKLIENIRRNVDHPKEIPLTDLQSGKLDNLEAVEEKKAVEEKRETGNRGWLMRVLRLEPSNGPVYSATGRSSESSIDTEYGIQNCFTYVVHMLSTIDIIVDVAVKAIYLKNCAVFKLKFRNGR